MGKIIYDNTGDVSLENLFNVSYLIDQTPLPTTEAARMMEIQERLKLAKERSINYSQEGKPRQFLFGKKQKKQEDAD